MLFPTKLIYPYIEIGVIFFLSACAACLYSRGMHKRSLYHLTWLVRRASDALDRMEAGGGGVYQSTSVDQSGGEGGGGGGTRALVAALLSASVELAAAAGEVAREVAGAGQDIRLDYDRKKDTSATVEASRNFANKHWNATRFALMHLGGATPAQLGEPDPSALQLADRWILSRLARVNRETAARYSSYALGEAAKGLYEFAWNDVCDWYLELSKRRLNPGEEPSTAALVISTRPNRCWLR